MCIRDRAERLATRRCASCGVTDDESLRSKNSNGLCALCRKLHKEGQFCPVCDRVWHWSAGDAMVGCDRCEMWIHRECDAVAAEVLDREQNGEDEDIPYACPVCRSKTPEQIAAEAKAKAAGKLPGDLSSVNEHLIRARKILIADGDILAHMEEISLMLQALELRLRIDALKKAAAEAGTDGVATILQLPNDARMMELHRENASLRQTIRFLERGRGQRRGTSDSAGTPPRMTMTRAEVEESYLGLGGLESLASLSARGLTAAAAPEARIVVDVEFPPEFGARGAAM